MISMRIKNLNSKKNLVKTHSIYISPQGSERVPRNDTWSEDHLSFKTATLHTMLISMSKLLIYTYAPFPILRFLPT